VLHFFPLKQMPVGVSKVLFGALEMKMQIGSTYTTDFIEKDYFFWLKISISRIEASLFPSPHA
jgi:hypothetical protein